MLLRREVVQLVGIGRIVEHQHAFERPVAADAQLHRMRCGLHAARLGEEAADQAVGIAPAVEVAHVKGSARAFGLHGVLPQHGRVVAPLDTRGNPLPEARQPQQCRHDVGRREQQIVHTVRHPPRIAHQKGNVQRLAPDRVLGVVGRMAGHRLAVVRSEDHDRVLRKPRPVQRSEQAAELTVDTAHVGEIVTHGGGLGHRRVGVVAHEQFGQRLVLVTFISLQVAVVGRSVGRMRRIHADHHQERFFGITHAALVFDIFDGFRNFVPRRPLVDIVTVAVGIPVMGMLVHVVGAVGVPVVEPVAAFGRRVGVPLGNGVADVGSRTLGVVLRREVGVQLADVGAVVARRREDVADTLGVLAQRTFGTLRHAVQHHAVPLGIHARKQHAPVGAAHGEIAHRLGQHRGFAGEAVEVGRCDRITLPPHLGGELRIAPEPQRGVAILVRKYVDHVGAPGLRLPAGRQGEARKRNCNSNFQHRVLFHFNQVHFARRTFAAREDQSGVFARGFDPAL